MGETTANKRGQGADGWTGMVEVFGREGDGVTEIADAGGARNADTFFLGGCSNFKVVGIHYLHGWSN